MNFFITVLIRILEGMFVVGITGSLIVLVLATIEDIRTMVEKDEPGESDQLSDELADHRTEQGHVDERRRRVANS